MSAAVDPAGSADRWQISVDAPPAYRDWCSRERLLFAAPCWQTALAALGLDHRYAWNPALPLGVLLPLRRDAGLRNAVLGFPVVPQPLQALSAARIEHEARRIAAAAGISLLRVNYSTTQKPVAQATAWRPEVWRDDIAAWVPDKRLRKDLALARRSELGLVVAPAQAADVAALFELYLSTVLAHGARANYTPDYFRSLIAMAEREPLLRVHCARGADGQLHGFAVSAVDGATGFYLHGAAGPQGRRSGVSDLLLEQVLAHARELHCARFTLMSSPWDQPGLLRFKSKWGDTLGYTVTTDVPGSIAGRLARTYARWRSRKDRGRYLPLSGD